jgi:transcriptional regulator with XRE-family HTH domain
MAGTTEAPALKAEVGHRLRLAREAKHLTQPALAELLKVRPQTVSGWEKGTREPDLSQLRRIADVLGVTVAWLVGEGDEDPPSRVLPLRNWTPHPYQRVTDQEEVIGERQFRCPVSQADPHDALWMVYRSGMVRVVCPDCGQYQVG